MKYLVVLDAGHGMDTMGKRTPLFDDGTFMKEREFNKAVVEKMIQQLKSYECEVLWVSQEDNDVALVTRSNRANTRYQQMIMQYGKENVSGVFVSIHANASSDTWDIANGIETFAYPSSKESSILATNVQDKLVEATKLKNRGVKTADFAVLRQSQMVAILCECGFMNFKLEAQLLKRDDYRELCATAIVKGIIEYLKLKKIFKVTQKAFKIQDYKAEILMTNKLTGDQIIKKYKPDLCMNLALYDMTTGQNITWMEDENKVSGYLFSKYGIGVKQDGTLIPTTKEEAYANNKIKDFAAGIPSLIINGVKTIDWGNKVSDYLNDNKHYRMMIGLDKEGNGYLCMCDEKMSIEECYEYCKQSGCVYAYVYDGNGSQFLYADSKVIRNSERTNASWLLLYKKIPSVDKSIEAVDKIKIEVNGKVKEVDAITLDGSTYIKLRDLADSKITIDYKDVPVIKVK